MLPELSTHGGNDGLEIIARQGNRWGSVCSDGKDTMLCPFIFDRVTPFEFGYLLVERNGKVSLWSRQEGDFIVPAVYKHIWFDEDANEIRYE